MVGQKAVSGLLWAGLAAATDGIVDGRVADPSHILQERGDFVGHTEEAQGLVDDVRPQIENQACPWCSCGLPGLADAFAEPVEAAAD